MLVILVVFIFLQSWRATLIPLLTVPVSLVGAFALFPLLGFSINTLSLFGLVLAIGLVVDDAIVVVEAVQHHIEHGLSPRDATVKAMQEVAGPVVAIALVLSAVFIPVAFVPGITGRMYQQFALTIAISVIISAINALTLSPALVGAAAEARRRRRAARSAASSRPSTAASSATTDALRRLDGRLRAQDRAHACWCSSCSRRARGLLRLAAARRLRARRGPGLPVRERPAPRRGLDGAHRRRVQAGRGDPRATRRASRDYNTVAGYSLISQSSATYNAFFFVSLEPWHERHTPETDFKAHPRRAEPASSRRSPRRRSSRSCRPPSRASARAAASR